jgi:hypothetical protein
MKQLDLLLPFALPPAELATDLLKAIDAPALAMMIGRGRIAARRNFDDFSRSLPHETWLAEHFGLDTGADIDSSPKAAIAAMKSFGLEAQAGHWFILHPVHIHIARDHLVLTDMRRLALSDIESRLLFEEALPFVQEAGLELRYGDALSWFLRADAWQGLQTATPDAAGGHNVDIWMPRGEGERAWRKLQNEIQMQWHAHAVNASRETTGGPVVNSLWLWGGATAAPANARIDHDMTLGLTGWAGMLARSNDNVAHARDLDAALSSSATRILAATDTLIEPAFAEDWGSWLARLHALETDWFAPLLAALKAGKIDHLRLILSHNTNLTEFSIDRTALRKFWASASLRRIAQ